MLRVTRAGSIALVTLVLSIAAHVGAGGHAPSLMGLAMVTVPLTLLAVAVTARRIGFPLLAGVFAVTQLGLHVAFEALTAPVMGVTTAGMPGAHHAGHLALTGAPPAVDPMGDVPAWMLIAHLVAALACALVLARGEQALWALVAWLAPALHAAVAAPVPVVHGLVAPTARVPGVLLRHLGRPAAGPREAGLPGGPDLLRRLGRHLGRPGRRGATRARAPRPGLHRHGSQGGRPGRGDGGTRVRDRVDRPALAVAGRWCPPRGAHRAGLLGDPPPSGLRVMRRSPAVRLVLAALVVVGALGAPAVTATPASAHDVLISTAPAANATVATVPAEVTLTFDEPAVAVGATIRVSGPAGDVQSGTPRLVDRSVTQDVAAGSPAGTYRVAWRVTSADGHPVTGEFSFTATASGGGTSTTTVAVPTRPVESRAFPGLPVAVAVILLLALGVALLVRRRAGGARRGGARKRPQDEGERSKNVTNAPTTPD